MDVKFEKRTLKGQTKSMLAVDFKRLFISPIFYIMLGVSLVIPILILVMTTMMDGTVSVDPQTGAETVMEGFKNVWQIIGSTGSSMSMDLTGMCNINMMYFLIAVFVCVFIADDFRSGYSKNLFTVRAKKTDYVVSKVVTCFVVGALMLITFFIGAMIGGKVAGLSFTIESATAYNVVMSMLAKIFLVMIFVAIFVLAAVIAKQRLWLSIILSLGIGMLFFTMVPIVTPLNAGILNAGLSLIGGILFSLLFGYLSTLILNKRDLI